MRKKLLSVHTAWAIRAKKIIVRVHGLGYSCEKKIASVRTARAIRAKKIPSIRTASAIRAKNIVIRPNGSSHPF